MSPKQFAEMAARLSGRGPAAAAPGVSTDAAGIAAGTVVLGIDPSLRGTGWGVVRVADPEPVHLASGTIQCPAGWERTRCLAEIGRVIAALVAAHCPSECVCEGLFFAQNLQTALIMGEARGAALASAAATGIPVHEIAPRKVKQAIVGYGAAQKIAVAHMVQRRLSLEALPAPDAADALALALAFIQERRRPLFATAKRI